MIAKHYLDAIAVYVHTDFDLLKDDEVLRAFVEQLEAIPGVETINLARYHVDVTVAFLFDTAQCVEKVLEVFEGMYGISARDQISVEDFMHKALGSEAVEPAGFADLFKASSLN